jgi:2-dehydro-3-deoxyphosphogluconate aldolase / (4S)-4-hydroxy-2-oxoglutarate aldolase
MADPATAVTAGPTRPPIPAGLASGGVVAIARHVRADDALAVAEALASGGVRAFELTLNDPERKALRAIEAVARVSGSLGLELGAGTVLSIESAARAVDAGASFLVMPHLDVELVAWAAERGVPALPGCATPTEAFAGWRAGAAAIKLFPASVAGPAFVRELHGPFPELPIVPTGGIDLESAPSFIAAGAVAVGLGGWLIGDGEPAGIGSRARQIVAAVAVARAEAAVGATRAETES